MRSFAFIALLSIFSFYLYFSNRDNKKDITKIEKDLKQSLKTKEFQKSLVVVNEQLKKNNLGQVNSKTNARNPEPIPLHAWKLGDKNQFTFPEKTSNKIYAYMNFVKNLDEKKSSSDPTKFTEVKEVINLLKTDQEAQKIWQAINSSEEFLDCTVCIISLMKMSQQAPGLTKGLSRELYRRAEYIITSKAIGDNVEDKKQIQQSLDFYLYKESVDFYLEQNKEDISSGDDTAVFKIKASSPHPIILEFMENKIKSF